MTTTATALRSALLAAAAIWASACGERVDAVTRAREDLATISGAVQAFATTQGSFPRDIANLVQPAKDGQVFLDGFPDVPRDPWGHPYRYLAPRRGSEFQVLSFGADGAPGGGGENADLVAGPGA